MGRDLAEVAHAAGSSTTGRHGGRVAVDSEHLRLLVLRPRDVGGVRPLLGPTVDHRPAARQVPRAQGRGGHAGGCVDAAVGGGPLHVGQAQQLGVRQVPRPEVLVVAAAGGAAGQRVAAGGTGAALVSDLEGKEKRKGCRGPISL